MTKKNKAPRILFIDLETLPNKLYAWRIGTKVNLNYDSIIEERSIICASWKWAGDNVIGHVCAKGVGNKKSDYAIVRRLYRVLYTADAVCGHNINKFDIPYIRARGIYHGLEPFPPIKQIDTYPIAKKIGYFNSYRLDYLAQFLGVGKKIKTDFDLWKRCARGDKRALARMVRYNKRDVRIVEKVFNKLRPYAPNHINRLLLGAATCECPACGGTKIQYRGWAYTKSCKYARFVCLDCHSWGRDTKRASSASKIGI